MKESKKITVELTPKEYKNLLEFRRQEVEQEIQKKIDDFYKSKKERIKKPNCVNLEFDMDCASCKCGHGFKYGRCLVYEYGFDCPYYKPEKEENKLAK